MTKLVENYLFVGKNLNVAAKPASSTEPKPSKEVTALGKETSGATTKEIEKPRSKSPEKLVALKEKISSVKVVEKEKETVKENATASTTDKEKEAPKLGDMPMATSAEKTESWATDAVKFTTGVDLKRPAPKDPLKPKLVLLEYLHLLTR